MSLIQNRTWDFGFIRLFYDGWRNFQIKEDENEIKIICQLAEKNDQKTNEKLKEKNDSQKKCKKRQMTDLWIGKRLDLQGPKWIGLRRYVVEVQYPITREDCVIWTGGMSLTPLEAWIYGYGPCLQPETLSAGGMRLT